MQESRKAGGVNGLGTLPAAARRLLLSCAWAATSHAQATRGTDDSARVMLQKFGDAWRGREELALDESLVLGFWVEGPGGGEYHTVLSAEAGARVDDGIPQAWDLGFALDMDFLRKLDNGEMSALTSMGQARSNDAIPLVPRFGPDFQQNPDAGLLFRRVSFHFWTRSWPETVPFGEHAARFVHGGNASVLLYDDEFRSAWYQLKPGMHINPDPQDQVNDFPQLLIITRGEFTGRFDGQSRILSEGEAVFIPPGMAHEFWADEHGYGEFVWMAFGDGA